jgi:cellulose synthase operon protein C
VAARDHRRRHGGRPGAPEATLEFARVEAQKAGKLPLKLPLAQSVKVKKDAVERAIAGLTRASDYNVAAVTTAATYELGLLYQAFSKSLLESERPRKLSALEREQYDLLLEEQAFPFEEKAIEWHEANLKRVEQGVYSEWIGRSLQALAQLAPGKYGKREQTAETYDALR